MTPYTAFCGLDCETCEARLATINDDDGLRRKVAALWSELNGVEITPDMIHCVGCRIDGIKTPYCDSLCPIRQCGLSRGYETCGDCRELEACEKVGMVTGNNPEAMRRLRTGHTQESTNAGNIVIRRETENDHRAVEHLVREAFWNVYRPGCLEHYVLHLLRNDPAFVPELDFVMEKDGVLIGQNVFMRAHIKADDGREIPIMTMGPICVAPELKRNGYGKMLLDYSLERAVEFGCPALCFEGNISFYGKSGFTYAREFGIRYHDLPDGADDSFFLCKELIPGYLSGITGEYAPPSGYFSAERDPEAFEAFDAQFPPKEKKKLPGQLV